MAMANGTSPRISTHYRNKRTPYILATIAICILTILVYKFGYAAIRLIAPCPSRSQLEFQLQGFINYRNSQSRQDTDRDAVMKGMTGRDIRADDERLVSVVRNNFVDLPRPYVTKFSLPLTKTPQAETVDDILKEKTAGFFVECGGLDGERSSNTLWLEQKRDWNGLLIEMDPSFYMQLRGKNRKCFSVNACLSPNTYPNVMEFREHELGEGQLVQQGSNHSLEVQKAYCFPFHTLMLALNRTKIDYLSLDVEGWELPILKTIPFDKIDISVVTVEVKHGKEGKAAYTAFMESVGFTYHSKLHFMKRELYLSGHDYVYVNKNLKV